jgi:hypothetical protein
VILLDRCLRCCDVALLGSRMAEQQDEGRDGPGPSNRSGINQRERTEKTDLSSLPDSPPNKERK